jgi:hypothetical protein
MRYVIGMLEGHWSTHFVSVTYSSHFFRRSFIPTTLHHSLLPHAVRREYCVRRGRSSQRVPRLQSLVRKDLDFCHVGSGFYIFLGLFVSTRGPDYDH